MRSLILKFLILLGISSCTSFVEIEHQLHIEDIGLAKEFAYNIEGYTSNFRIDISDTISCNALLIFSDSIGQGKFYSTELELKKGDFVNKRLFDWYEDGITVKYIPKDRCEEGELNIQLLILTEKKDRAD